jgi:adenylate cyclase
MAIEDLRNEIADEVAAILASDFQIDVSQTDTVPHSSDPAITFPNLDTRRQGSKLIDTCVLYIDIRRSTELNLAHRPTTVAKLYSAFVRAMTRCARYHGGHVRGIIGDRVMVIFDRKDSFRNAVECAVSMNSTSQHVIDAYFKRGEVECGIGIDAGRMLATKTGVRRRGAEQQSYRNLVWLGRPANVASKLTDLANKAEERVTVPTVSAGFRRTLLGAGVPASWRWEEITPWDFVRKLCFDSSTGHIRHSDLLFEAMSVQEKSYVTKPKTAAILMTDAVWNGYKSAQPNSSIVTESMFKAVTLAVPGYSGAVFGGDVHYRAFKM